MAPICYHYTAKPYQLTIKDHSIYFYAQKNIYLCTNACFFPTKSEKEDNAPALLAKTRKKIFEMLQQQNVTTFTFQLKWM